MSEKIKTVDLDAAFDKRVAEYFSKKKNKYTEEQWEDLVPELYRQFADTKIESLNATPNEYYKKMSQEELSTLLKAHFEKGVGIDGFFRAALEEDRNKSVLLELLDASVEEATFALEILGADKELYPEYLSLLRKENAEGLYGEITALLQEDADTLCDELLELYGEGFARECIADILSCCLIPREEVFSLLLNEFLKTERGVEAAVNRLIRYADERALPYIKERAALAETGYLDWRAMRLAAEALGGSIAERDFKNDEEYIILQREEARQREEREKELSKQ